MHVSEVGAPHLVDPSRLERSARRLYGDAFDPLWGELAPVPEQNVQVAGERVVGLECFPSPGHASHHVCYFDGETLYAGDAAGVRIQPHRSVLPPTPPPETDVEGWYRTLEQIERCEPARLALVHFGVAEDVSRHLAELRERLDAWARRVESGVSEEEFVACRARRPRARGGGRLRARDAVLAVLRRAAAVLGHARGGGRRHVGSLDRSGTHPARPRGLPGRAASSRRRDDPARRLAPLRGDVVRLGRRAHPPEHGRDPRPARPSPARPTRLPHHPRQGRLVHACLPGRHRRAARRRPRPRRHRSPRAPVYEAGPSGTGPRSASAPGCG